MEHQLPPHITGEQDFHGAYYLAILKELQRLNDNIEKLLEAKADVHRGAVRESDSSNTKRLGGDSTNKGSVRGRGGKPRSDNE